MPLIDLLGPRIADRAPDLGRADRVVADLGMAAGMRIDAAAEVTRQHLGAETDAEKRLFRFERHRDPVGLAAHEIICIVGAHGAAKDDRTGVLHHGPGQWIAKAWPADVERVAALRKRVT